MAVVVDRADFLFREMCRSIPSFDLPYSLKVLGVSYASYVVVKTVYRFLNESRIFFEPLMLPQRDFRTEYGEWGIVTGCTSGIGRHMANELARRKLNVVLLGRNPEKLSVVSKEIETEFDVKTMVIEVDFVRTDIYEEIENRIRNLDIGVLINNVAMIQEKPAIVSEVSSTTVQMYLNVNVMSMVMMSRIVLTVMKKQRRGALINLSSFANEFPWPTKALYASSKAFVRNLSESLSYEYEPYGIEVLTLTPMGVATNMLSTVSGYDVEPSFLTPSPENFARISINTLGRSKANRGCWSHYVFGEIIKRLPMRIVLRHLRSVGAES